MLAYRIADSRRAIFDGTGAMLNGGRWNSPGKPVIYAAESYASAMLEVLVHANLSLIPRHHAWVEIFIPDGLKIEGTSATRLIDWPRMPEAACRELGDEWLRRGESAVLRVPSVVTAGHEHNLVLNPAHPAFARIRAGAPTPVVWDPRLFRTGR